jgi:hypothetical protein
MLLWKRGFTVIQLITGMTVVGLIGMGIFVALAQQAIRDNQRRDDLATVYAMVQRHVESHMGKYPGSKDADNPGSDLQAEFGQLRLIDPKSGDLYTLGSDFSDCKGSGSSTNPGPGYMSYTSPGDNGRPYMLRVCLEHGEFYYYGD